MLLYGLVKILKGLKRRLRVIAVIKKTTNMRWDAGMNISVIKWMRSTGRFGAGLGKPVCPSYNSLEAIKHFSHPRGSPGCS